VEDISDNSQTFLILVGAFFIHCTLILVSQDAVFINMYLLS